MAAPGAVDGPSDGEDGDCEHEERVIATSAPAAALSTNAAPGVLERPAWLDEMREYLTSLNLSKGNVASTMKVVLCLAQGQGILHPLNGSVFCRGRQV